VETQSAETAEPIRSPGRTHFFRPLPEHGRRVCADCIFLESHTVHIVPDPPPDTRYEPSERSQ